MTREEAANLLDHYCYGNTNILRDCDDDIAEKIQTAMDEAIAALRFTGPVPDPETGLVPCGCGGAAVDNVGIDYRYGYKCQKCGIETEAGPNRDCAKEVWNTAMGWKGGAE